MSAERSLRLVDTATGDFTEYDGDDAQEIMRLRDRVRELEQAVELAEKDLRVKRAKITELRNLHAVERQKSSVRPMIERVFAHWQQACHHERCKLTADRFDAMWEIIKGHGVKLPDTDEYELRDWPALASLVALMKMAVDGAAHDPFITRRKNGTQQRHDDLTLIFRSSDKMDEFCRRSPQAAVALKRAQARQRDARLRLPDPRSIGGSWALEAKMLAVFNGNGPHLQAR